MLIRRGALRELWHSSAVADAQPAVPTASDRDLWDGMDRGIRDLILTESGRLAGQAWPYPMLSQWAAYARTGDRIAYETRNFERNRRIRLHVLAAALDPSDDRILAAADGLWQKTEQATWCWPAHDDAFARGQRVPDPDRPFVDLGAGEDAALVAWSVLVLRDQLERLSPGLVDRLAAETRRRVLEPFTTRRDWHWEGTEEDVHNWAPWIHGNLIIAAAAFTEGEQRDEVIALCVDGIDRYLAQLPADGAIDEGFAYWWQGAARAFDALALLDGLSGGAVAEAVAGGELAGLTELARFPERLRLGRGWFASFSDAEARADDHTPWHTLFRAARLCGLDDTATFALGERTQPVCGLDSGVAAGLGRMLAELTDIRAGVVDAVPPQSPDPWGDSARDVVVRDTAVLLASIGLGIRSSAGLSVVAKGGHNGENHNHNDLGSIAVAVDGIPLLPDLGRAEYTAQTFSERRYELWNVGSEWHSAPMPRGLAQLPGAQWRAPVTEIDHGWSIDLTGAYPDAGAWTRTVTASGGVVRVIDDGDAVGDPQTRIVVVCAGVPERAGDGILVPGRHGSRGLHLTFDPAGVSFETRRVDDPHLRRSWGAQVTRMLFTPAEAGPWEMTASTGR